MYVYQRQPQCSRSFTFPYSLPPYPTHSSRLLPLPSPFHRVDVYHPYIHTSIHPYTPPRSSTQPTYLPTYLPTCAQGSFVSLQVHEELVVLTAKCEGGGRSEVRAGGREGEGRRVEGGGEESCCIAFRTEAPPPPPPSPLTIIVLFFPQFPNP